MIELRHIESDADVSAYADVRNRVEPLDPVDEARVRRQLARPDRLDLVTWEGDAAVAMGFARRNPEDPDSQDAFARAFVLPEHRCRGIGTQLFGALSLHAHSLGRGGLVTEVREDARESVAYLARRGFETVLRTEQIALDVPAAVVVSDPPEGASLVPLVDEWLEPLVYDAAVEIEADLPVVERQVTPPFDEWRAMAFSDDLLRSCSFAALAGYVVVGFGVVYERPYGAEHGLTGVRPEWRRRGVARAIKSAQIAAAKAAGIAELRTWNELGNAPIRRLNESLGYRVHAAWLVQRGPLIGGLHVL